MRWELQRNYFDEIEPELVSEWTRACTDVYRVLKRGRSTVGRQGDGEALSEAQVGVIETIGLKGELTVGEIANSVGTAQPTVTRMLNKLEAKGIVTKHRSAEDERKTILRLSETGKKVWHEKREVLFEYQRDALLRFPAEQRREVVTLLQEFVTIVSEQIDNK